MLEEIHIENLEGRTSLENQANLRRISLVAMLAAAAAALQILEAPLPKFFPWLKLGLANVLTLYGIIKINAFAGIGIAILRTCLAAIFLGSFLSPVHLISFSGAFVAALLMSLFHKFSPQSSICAISIIGAISSNLAQLFVVQLLFASNLSFWFHIAVVIWVGIPTGIVVGKITYELLRRI